MEPPTLGGWQWLCPVWGRIKRWLLDSNSVEEARSQTQHWSASNKLENLIYVWYTLFWNYTTVQKCLFVCALFSLKFLNTQCFLRVFYWNGALKKRKGLWRCEFSPDWVRGRCVQALARFNVTDLAFRKNPCTSAAPPEWDICTWYVSPLTASTG